MKRLDKRLVFFTEMKKGGLQVDNYAMPPLHESENILGFRELGEWSEAEASSIKKGARSITRTIAQEGQSISTTIKVEVVKGVDNVAMFIHKTPAFAAFNALALWDTWGLDSNGKSKGFAAKDPFSSDDLTNGLTTDKLSIVKQENPWIFKETEDLEEKINKMRGSDA